MPEIEIRRWSESQTELYLKQLKDVFYATSSTQSFASEEEKGKFFESWAGYYLQEMPETVYFAVEKKDKEQRLLGYLTACFDSRSMRIKNYYKKMNPSYFLFEDLFEKFPCHFHINCSTDSQGKGVGRKLVEKLFDELKKKNVSGVHIITAANADNRKFYAKMGMNTSENRMWKSTELCFMGREF